MCLLTHTVPAVNQGTRTGSNSIDYLLLLYIQYTTSSKAWLHIYRGRVCLWLRECSDLALFIPPYGAWANLQEQTCSSSFIWIDFCSLRSPGTALSSHSSSLHLPTYLGQLWKAPGIASSLFLFFFFSSAPLDTLLWQTFLHVYCHSWQSWGWMEAASCTWARQSLLPLLTHKHTFVFGIMAKIEEGFENLSHSQGPFQHRLISLIFKLHQDTGSNTKMNNNLFSPCVVSEARKKEMLLCWLTALPHISHQKCHLVVCLYSHPEQVFPGEKCELCHNLPATEWKQLFGWRPVRAEKGKEEVVSGSQEKEVNWQQDVDMAQTTTRFSSWGNSGGISSVFERGEQKWCVVPQPNTKDPGTPE